MNTTVVLPVALSPSVHADDTGQALRKHPVPPALHY
jgi:hypothetical protein